MVGAGLDPMSACTLPFSGTYKTKIIEYAGRKVATRITGILHASAFM